MQGKILRANENFLKIMGYRSDEIHGQHHSMFCELPLNTSPADRELWARIGQGEFDSGVYKRFGKHGKVVWLQVSYVPIFEADGKGIKVVMFAVDISGDKHNAEALKKSSQLVRSIVETIVDGVISISHQGVIESFNPASEKIFGYSADEVIGQNVKMLMPEPYHSEHDGYLSHHIATGEKKVIGIGREVVGLRKDGSTFPMDLAVSTVMIGKKRHFVGIVRDQTERTQSEHALTNAQVKLQGVFNSVIDGIVIIDAKGTVDAFNPAAESIFGYEEQEVIGENVKVLMPEPYRGEHDGYLHNHATTGENKIIGIGREVTGRRKDGTLFPMDLAVSPMQVSGKPMFVGLVRNISTRKQSEKELKLAKFTAESANRMKSEFLANMSHELRTPLNAIIGYSELLKEEAEDDGNTDIVQDLNRIHTAGNHLLKLINDVLDLAKIEAGRVELVHEQVSVSALLQELDLLIRHQMDKNANRFEVICDEDINNITSDSSRLRQILLNLLSNAAKFTSKGQVTLAVKREQQRGVEYLAFSVSDSGIGMTPEQLDKVFIPFVQADATTTRQFGGTGLGLAICKDLCHIMGGTIDASSEAGKGSTFTVHIPVDSSSLLTPNSGEKEPLAGNAMAMDISSYSSGNHMQEGECVLVIDDDYETRNLMIRTLEKDGFGVVAVSNGPEGIALAIKLKPLSIILDIMMPEMDGWEVLRILRASPETANIPIIINTIADEQQRAEEEGVTAYLSKPLKKTELLGLLNELAPQQQSADVLVVEDEADIRELLVRQLATIGWSARTCENGLAALHDVKQTMPDIILLDLMMPKMDGFEFLAQLRKLPTGRKVPVVILTAKDISEQEDAFLNGSAQLVIRKGDLKNIADLLPIVRRFMRKPKLVEERS